MDKIVLIGCGGVGFCLLEIMKLEKLYYDCVFMIIDPKKNIADLDEVMKGRQYTHVKEAITRDNHKKLLSIVDEKTFIINVSVNVSSVMLLKYATAAKAWYIDTSLEEYQDFIHVPIDTITKYSEFKQNNLYHQNLEAFKSVGKSRKTRIISGGANPALVNEFAKKALKIYATKKGFSFKDWDGNYAKLGHDMGLSEIQVVEYDTQKLKVKANKNLFVSTWSSIGFQEEAGDLVMLSLNNEDIKDLEKANFKLIKPTEGKSDTHIRFIAERGMNMMRESVTLDDKGKPFNYTGRLIPHAEIITMSEFFQYKGEAPSIMYVYRPCDEAMRSLEFFRENDYKELPKELVVRGDQVTSGYDSIGALLTFKNGDRFGGWTVCGIDDTRKLGILSNPTTLQVISFMLPAIKWALINKNKGLNNAETIPNAFIFKHGQKYMGKVFFKSI